MSGFYQWIDALWIPVLLLSTHGMNRLLAAGFVCAGMLMMRLQVELMESIGYPNGILQLLKIPLFERGLIIYSVFYLLYAIMAHYSPGATKVIVLASSITMLFSALLVSSIAMVL